MRLQHLGRQLGERQFRIGWVTLGVSNPFRLNLAPPTWVCERCGRRWYLGELTKDRCRCPHCHGGTRPIPGQIPTGLVDVVLGKFACTPHSVAGRRRAAAPPARPRSRRLPACTCEAVSPHHKRGCPRGEYLNVRACD